MRWQGLTAHHVVPGERERGVGSWAYPVGERLRLLYKFFCLHCKARESIILRYLSILTRRSAAPNDMSIPAR